jgi:NTP pyrophosphatase (non-canonical NTP hydrolase)
MSDEKKEETGGIPLSLLNETLQEMRDSPSFRGVMEGTSAKLPQPLIDGVNWDPLTLDDYQEQAVSTAVYPGKGSVAGLTYATLGLVGEAGEVAEKVKKLLRDDDGVLTEDRRQALIKEIGDVCWYVSTICTELDIPLSEVALRNLDKLNDRKQRGALQGSGDDR